METQAEAEARWAQQDAEREVLRKRAEQSRQVQWSDLQDLWSGFTSGVRPTGHAPSQPGAIINITESNPLAGISGMLPTWGWIAVAGVGAVLFMQPKKGRRRRRRR